MDVKLKNIVDLIKNPTVGELDKQGGTDGEL